MDTDGPNGQGIWGEQHPGGVSRGHPHFVSGETGKGADRRAIRTACLQPLIPSRPGLVRTETGLRASQRGVC